MQSEQVVDVLTLPQLTMVTRLTAASLRSLAGLLNSLADTLGQVEVVAEKVEMVSNEVEVMTDQEDKVEDSNSCQKHPARFRCDTVCSEDSGIDLDLDTASLISDSESSESQEGADTLSECSEDFELDSDNRNLNTDPETGLRLISLDEVRDHCSLEDGWMVLFDRVYNVSHLVRLHPGGEEVMADYLGYDATIAFQGVGHSKAASRMLQPNLIGILPQDERLNFSL